MGDAARKLPPSTDNVVAGPWASKPAEPSLKARTLDVFSRVLPGQWPGYAPRDGQMVLTSAIADAVEQGGVLLAEGPCGVGKSLAYLVPAILRADKLGKTVVVVTASIALQEQLVQHDLPALAEALKGELRGPLTFALLKGRQNYLCLHALAEAGANPPALLSRDDLAELATIDRWARTTTTGDRLELPMIVKDGTWALRSTGTDDCLRDGCDHYDDCFARAAKARAESVRVLVINYHLLFAHIAVKAESGADLVIPKTAGFGSPLAWDTILCDEAHEAGDIARDFLGCDMSEAMVRRVASWLKEDAKTCADDLRGDRLTLAADIEREASALWRDMVDRVPRAERGHGSKPDDERTHRLREGLPAQALHDLVAKAHGVAAALFAKLAKHAADLDRDEKKVMRRAESCARRARRIASWLDTAICPSDAPHVVLWLGVREVGRFREERATFHGRLLDVGAVLKDELFERTRAVVLTSATLTTGGTPPLNVTAPAGESDTWGWIRAQVGLPASTPALAVASPFDFARQAVLCLPSGFPSPKTEREAFDKAVCEAMARVARAAQGRTLGLFTSRRMADRAAAYLRTLGLPYPILCQGEQPRPHLLAAMKAQPSILCGTSSLWTGVDLPGEAVVAVVIDKLPFTPPDDPVMQALGELAAYRTGDRMAGFTQESLPRATLEVRQGVGRLIRSVTDWGAVVLCDSRLTTAGYGKKVIASLGMPARVHSLAAVEAWFNDRSSRMEVQS